MKEKIKVAFIYHKNNIFLTGKHFDNTFYNFYMVALKRNPKIDVSYFNTDEEFDTKILKDKFDIIQLWGNTKFGMPKKLIGIEDLDIPVISCVGDPVDAKESIPLHEEWKIDHYFHFYSKEFFYSLYPKSFKYKTIIFGLETSLYQNIKPFENRINNKILLTGAIGNTKLWSRIINDIKRPKWNAYRFYYLRTKCSKIPYVEYTSTLNHKYINDQYPKLLEKYAAVIAATTYNPNIKYWENAAAGCLTFMEITKKNKGEYLGYIDDETAIFINEYNYEDKFKKFLNDSNNLKWKKIAEKGRKFTLENLNNDKAVEGLIEIMESLI
jgi:hypothetical protein